MAVELWNTSLWNDAYLKAYYRLNDATDNTPNPTYGLTNTNSVAFNPAYFDNGADMGTANTNKYLSIASDLGIAGNSDLTLMTWFKVNTEITSGVYNILSHASNTNSRYFQVYYDYNGGARRLVLDASGAYTVTYAITLGTTNWYHIAATRSVGGNAGILYVNAVNQGSGTLAANTPNVNSFHIGADHTNSSLASAIYDDNAAFSRVLSATEISDYYNGNLTPFSHFLPKPMNILQAVERASRW